jgi:hypothetical protein
VSPRQIIDARSQSLFDGCQTGSQKAESFARAGRGFDEAVLSRFDGLQNDLQDLLLLSCWLVWKPNVGWSPWNPVLRLVGFRTFFLHT